MSKAKGGTSSSKMGAQFAKGTAGRINAQIAKEGGNVLAPSRLGGANKRFMKTVDHSTSPASSEGKPSLKTADLPFEGPPRRPRIAGTIGTSD